MKYQSFELEEVKSEQVSLPLDSACCGGGGVRRQGQRRA